MKKGTPRKTPRPVNTLTPEQERELAEHLASKLNLPDAARVFYAIEHWLHTGPKSATQEKQETLKAQRQHFARVAALTHLLQEELRVERPLWNTDGLDWTEFDGMLERVRLSSEEEASGPEPRARWRESLIAIVWAHYPEDLRSVSWVSHFEETIRLVLGFLGIELADLHRQVVRDRNDTPASQSLDILEPISDEPRAHLPWSAAHKRRS